MNETPADHSANTDRLPDSAAIPAWLRWLTVFAGVLGLALVFGVDWVIVSPNRRPIVFGGNRRWLVIAAAVLLAGCRFVPPVLPLITRALDPLRHPAARGRPATT